MQTWHVILLGLIEGLTEFIPVSSTGHLLLAGHFLGVDRESHAFTTFVVLIQLGAVLAILSVYSRKLWSLFTSLPVNPTSRRFVAGILLAFLPAAVLGAAGHSYIKNVLFETPSLVCLSLIIGGIVLLVVDRLVLVPDYTKIEDFPLPLAFKIGIFQCLALVPGVSRSGATIVGALLLGTDKRSAAEFSFYLAMPTMAGAFAYDLYKNWATLDVADITGISLGFVVAFVAALLIVRYVLDFIVRHGFAPFAYWRILVGTIGIAGLALAG